MKVFSWIKVSVFVLIALGAQVVIASPSKCQVIKLEVRDGVYTHYGNAIPFTTKSLIVNDHSLGLYPQPVLELPTGQRVEAKVVRRDFHRDLAILEIVGAGLVLSPCQFRQNRNLHPTGLMFVGHLEGERGVQAFKVEVLNTNFVSQNIPGLQSGWLTEARVRRSQSGSALLDGKDNVMGLLSHLTPEGRSVFTPSSQVLAFIQEYQKDDFYPHYQVNYQQRSIEFRGLQVDIGELFPARERIVGGDIHGFFPELQNGDLFVRKSVQMKNYVEATFDPSAAGARELKINQPQLYRDLMGTSERKILIQAVDGQKVSNSVEFLRALGNCEPCLVDQYLVLNSKNLSAVELFEQLAYFATELARQIQPASEQGGESTVSLASDLTQALRKFSELSSEMGQLVENHPDGYPTEDWQKLISLWSRIDDQTLAFALSDAALETLYELRRSAFLMMESRR